MITIQASPLPSNFRGTPQELFEAMLDRIEIVSDGESFVISDSAPSSNQGPWLKGGKQWWVWDSDTSTYIPLDVSESVSDQISIGAEEPDPDEFQLWLKLSGSTVLGLYYYAGSSAGWVAKADELSNESVTTAMIETGAVTAEKLANGAVTATKLANDLPLTKWERGTAYQVIRMDGNGGYATWQTLLNASELMTITGSTNVEISHGLDRTPRFVQVVFVCTDTDLEYEVDDELSAESVEVSTSDDREIGHPVYRTDEKIGIRICDSTKLRAYKKNSNVNDFLTVSKWKIKFYYAA